MVKELSNRLFYYEVYYSKQSYRDIKNQRETEVLGPFGTRAPIADLHMTLIASSDQEARDTFVEWLIKEKHKGKKKYPESYVDLIKKRFREQKEIALPPDDFYKITELVKQPLDKFPIRKGLVLRVFQENSH